ncbi:hypothetical protein L7F22_047287 [Adiantum nelumboides]|nr:hypothetical protein [Adiantum nelumboides]
MITTRQSAEFLYARDSHTYNLSLLNEMNAKSLFCYWAFGQNSIPDWIDEPLGLVVTEVIKDCKGLPLALKVIGTSLSATPEDPPALGYWRHTRDKLREAGLLGDTDIGHATDRKTADELVFTQHDVLRDPVLQLADKEQPKSRLLMPGMTLRNNLWKSEKSCGAEVISIHSSSTGVNELDRLAGLAFPESLMHRRFS